jgi:transcriptional regulator with XRE-family HTH domain
MAKQARPHDAAVVPGPPSISKPLGLAIRRLRESKGLSIEEFALSSPRIDVSYMNDIELGKRNPTLEKLEAISAKLGLSVTALFQAADEEATGPRDTEG